MWSGTVMEYKLNEGMCVDLFIIQYSLQCCLPRQEAHKSNVKDCIQDFPC